MTNMKISTKMHLFIIVSSIVIALGLAIGLIFQFVGNGFFNWGENLRSYQSITITYKITDGTKEDIQKIAEDSMNGVNYYACEFADNTVIYKFNNKIGSEKLQSIAQTINGKFDDESLSVATYSKEETQIVAGYSMIMASVVLACEIVFEFLYFAIRYRLGAAICATIANLHNMLLYLALLAITRIQVTGSIVALTVLIVTFTMILCAIYFGYVRRLNKKDDKKGVADQDMVDQVSDRFAVPTAFIFGIFVVAAVLIAVLTMLGSLSLASLLMSALSLVLMALSTYYGCIFFMPSVYARLKSLGMRKPTKTGTEQQSV